MKTAQVQISKLRPPADPQLLAEQIKQKARDLGFDLVGITSAEPSSYADYFQQWIAQGRAGTMQYMAERFDERTDPARYFSGARSVICVACNYRIKLENDVPSDHGRIARYALGDDYHIIMKDRLHDLADWLRDYIPGTKTKSGVDTAPIMEKELAARAGLGWMGKNTCIINQQLGSFILLGEILTTLDLPMDQPATDHCASCNLCIEACPTSAITAPYQLDASRCISYLTIEHRSDITQDLQSKMGDWMYGCDICQDVCPWNRKSPSTSDAAFEPRLQSGSLSWQSVLDWTDDDYRSTLKGSAMKRVKLPMLQRNARIVSQNNKT